MSNNFTVPQIYDFIILDVIEKMNRKFAELGLDENVLNDLKTIWQEKIARMSEPSRTREEYNYGYEELYIPQNDSESKEKATTAKKQSRQDIDQIILNIPQNDALNDSEDEEEQDGDNSEIGSDLDSDEDDENVKTDHLILCQFEKVSRVKNKWKCILKDGIVNINGQDYVFSRANGDFDW